jgi:hypothetical protein
MRRRLLSFSSWSRGVTIALALVLSAACGASRSDVERHLGNDRYARALRVARRIDDPGLRLASETLVAERLLRQLEGALRVSPEPDEALRDRLGVLPEVFASGDALSLMFSVDVRRSGPASMSFRILGLTFDGRRYLRASRCPPDEAVDLSCAEWLSGAPLVPACVVEDPDRGGRAAVGAVRWVSGGLVNARPPPSPRTVCERPPVTLDPATRTSLTAAGQRLAAGLARIPRRATAGRRYMRSELLYASPDPASGRDLRIQMAFHVDRRGAPIRRTAILPLPSAASPEEAIDRLFAEPLALARAFRIAAPPGGRSELDEVAP